MENEDKHNIDISKWTPKSISDAIIDRQYKVVDYLRAHGYKTEFETFNNLSILDMPLNNVI